MVKDKRSTKVKPVVLLTCEHAGNFLPKTYRQFFQTPKAQAALDSHRGYDRGALALARHLALKLDIKHFFTFPYSRLLVEINRSPGHPGLWSRWSNEIPLLLREKILREIYFPYQNQIIKQVHSILSSGQTLIHVGVHSFTPKLRGEVRNCQVGLLYDSTRPLEKNFCQKWQKHLNSAHVKTRRNYPYLGKSDGLITMIRKKVGENNYLGIELETNQSLYDHRGNFLNPHFSELIAETFQKTLKVIDE